jgi:hypothetical protein
MILLAFIRHKAGVGGEGGGGKGGGGYEGGVWEKGASNFKQRDSVTRLILKS